tara:strand:+ start:187 stop:618 length:432 start_codon:yes stop_codon:yes gene_type:complete
MNNDQEQDRGEFAPATTVFNDLTSLKHKTTVGPIESAMREQRIQDGDLMNVMRQEGIERSGWVPSFEEALEWQRRQQLRAENIQRAVDRVTPPFKPDYNTEAVLVEEMQRMAKRIEELEVILERQTARIVDLQTHIENFDGEE